MKYDVKSLNYISSGKNRTFVNVDISARHNLSIPVHLLAHNTNGESPLSSDILTESDRDMIRVRNSTDTQGEDVERYQKYMDSYAVRNNVSFVFDNCVDTKDDNANQITDTRGTNVKPMYDMKDVCVKSSYNKVFDCLCNVDFNGEKTEDIYLPQFDDEIVMFAQVGSDSYMLFPMTPMKENTIGIDLADKRGSEDVVGRYCARIDVDEKTRTYLYKDLSTIASNIDFRPKAHLEGLQYNYMAVIDVDNMEYPSFTNGNQYGELFKTKNSYDAMYSMNMSSDYQIRDCRKYCGLGTNRRNVFLKYYDSQDYVSSDAQFDDQVSCVTVKNVPRTRIPYQKIEYFIPNSMTNTSNHKSNMFSIRINNSKLDSGLEKYESDVFLKLKKDIKNAVRDICENITPANTQLYNVEFSYDGGL